MGVHEGPYGRLFRYGLLLLVYHDRSMCLVGGSPQGRHSCIGTTCPRCPSAIFGLYFALSWQIESLCWWDGYFQALVCAAMPHSSIPRLISAHIAMRPRVDQALERTMTEISNATTNLYG